MTLSMTGFIKLLKIIAAASSIFSITTLVTYIFSVIKSVRYKYPYTIYDTLATFKADDFKNSWRISIIIFLIISMFAIIFTNAAALELIGNDNIELKPSGTYCYFVNIKNNKYDYTLPAQIRVEHSSQTYYNGSRERIRYYKDYYIEKVYFSNGGYLYFEDFSVKPDVTSENYDQSGRKWTCTLLRESAYSPHIKETSHINTKEICFLIFELTSVGFAIVCLICKKTQNPKQLSLFDL